MASHLKKKLLVVDFSSLNSSKHSNADAYRIVFREAKIHGAIVFIDECDELFESRDRGGKGAVTVALREMETFDGIMVLATNRPQMLDEAMHRRIALSLMFEPPDARLRLAIWQKHIPKNLQLDDDVDLKSLAIEFELTGGFIKNAVFQALAQAVNRVQLERKGEHGKDGRQNDCLKPEDVVVKMCELRQACRLQARGDLKRCKLERRVLPDCGLDQLIASKEAHETLREIVNVEKVRAVMSTRWGFNKDHKQGRCNCVIIMGPVGSGKTFTASCLGYETGRPLQRLSASELQSIRDGQNGNMSSSSSSSSSSSQIGDIFNQANVAGAVVVIEHAEQLLNECLTSNDNSSGGLELLYHMQSFDGLIILCCTSANGTGDIGWPLFVPIPNRIGCLLSYIVKLKTPDMPARIQLWKQLMPNETPIKNDVDDDGLLMIAEKYVMSGAKISACIRKAAAMVAMRKNRAALFTDVLAPNKNGDGVDVDDDEGSEKVGLQDLKDACEAELRLKNEIGGDSMWATSLFV